MHYCVCVNEGHQKSYFNEVRDALRRLDSSPKDNQVLDSSYPYPYIGNQVLDSSYPYTCTILSIVDRLDCNSLHAYTSAEREYNYHTGDARLLAYLPG